MREPACDPTAPQEFMTMARYSKQRGPRVQGYRAGRNLSSDHIPSRSQPQHKAPDTQCVPILLYLEGESIGT